MRSTAPKTRETYLSASGDTTLMPFLLLKMGGMSRNGVKQLLSHRQVSVNGAVETRFDRSLHAGDKVKITTGTSGRELTHPKLRVVYEDDHLLVAEKKPGLLTVATYAGSHEVTCFSLLKSYVRQKNPRAGIYVVHRLDRETSGLLVFAKTPELQHYMRDYWREIVTRRTYVAVAEGLFSKPADKITTWFTEDPKTTMVYSSPVDDGGKKAVTNYKVLKARAPEGANPRTGYSLVELNLETGRTNQIRVHLAGIGHPVAGDRKYGSGNEPPIDRLALHARVLEFIHPFTEEKVCFETPVPREFLKIFR